MNKVKRALISVSDKTGIDEFVRGLNKMGVEILSTGGTAKRIEGLGIPVRRVSSYTGFPEMLDGRVKTLHPKIHGGLLALRGNVEHMKQVQEHDIELIDMVVVNLYPFEKTVAKKEVSLEEAIENIDIGGPSMLRSAAKNYKAVAVVCNPARYADILEEMQNNDGSVSNETKTILAVEVFERTNEYDRAIYNYLSNQQTCSCKQKEDLPQELKLQYQKVQDLRYGENSHQRAAFYKDAKCKEPSVSCAEQLSGKELSFNNILDLDAAIEIVKDFKEPAASVIKHTNPCGAAVAETLSKAYLDALDCDKLSAFGSIVGLNRKVDEDTAKEITSADFVECIIAPGYEDKALDILKEKKNLRIMRVPTLGGKPDLLDYNLKKVTGGVLLQERDINSVADSGLKVVTSKKPTQEELKSLLFGYTIVKHVKSNAIVLSQGTKTVGIGAGQMSRVDSVIISIRKSSDRSKGTTLASDAFFPKADAIEEAAKAGITAIVQPGGSKSDEEIIAACNNAGIAMVFAGLRHFKH